MISFRRSSTVIYEASIAGGIGTSALLPSRTRASARCCWCPASSPRPICSTPALSSAAAASGPGLRGSGWIYGHGPRHQPVDVTVSRRSTFGLMVPTLASPTVVRVIVPTYATVLTAVQVVEPLVLTYMRSDVPDPLSRR